jgi:xylobiose transport system substrate-binding protein
VHLRFRKRRWSAAIAAAALLTSVSACASNGTGSGSSSHGTLRFYMYQDASTKVQTAAVAAFNKTSSVKVQLVGVPGSDYSNKLIAAMGSSNAPDLFFNWGGGSIKPYVQDNLLLNLTPTLNSDPSFKNSFLPSVLNAGKINGQYYGIPMRGMQPVMLFYNKAMFAQDGLQPPKTWSDLLKLVTYFKSKNITPIAEGGSDAWTEQMWLEELVDRFGGPQVFANIAGGNSSGWGNQAVQQAAQYTSNLVNAGAFGKNFASVSYVNGGASALLNKGKAAMELMGSWEYSTQLTDAPTFAKQDLGYVNFPSVPGGTGNLTDVVGNPTNYISINAHTKYKAAALAFIKTLSSTFYTNQLIKDGEVPATTTAKSLLNKEPTPAFATFTYDMVQNAPSFTLSWDQALEAAQATPMQTNIQKLFNGQLSPPKFISAMKNLS